MKRWKALAGATLVAALVMAPLASPGAYAAEETSDSQSAAAAVDDVKKVFVCKYTRTPGSPETLQGGNNPTSVSVSTIKGWNGTLGTFFGDGQNRSVVIAYDERTGGGQEGEPSIDECPSGDPRILVTPTGSYSPPSCEAPGSLNLGEDVGYHWNEVLSQDGASTTYTAEPNAGFIFPDGFALVITALNNLSQLEDDWLCRDEYPVPALFSAQPTAASCTAAGSFSTEFLGEPYYDDEEGYREYEFENVFVGVVRSVEGEVTLAIWAKDGFELTGLDPAVWTIEDSSTYAYRTIMIPAQLSGPELCPLALLPAPAAPTFTDACGIADDEYAVPDDTETYFYDITEEGDSVFVEVVLVDEEDTFPDGTVVDWDFTFTDVACPASVPGAPTALPATGGTDMTPWGVGAAVMMLAGAALLTTRRLARR